MAPRKKLVHKAYIEAAESIAAAPPAISAAAPAQILPIEYYGDLTPVTADMALMPGVLDEGTMAVIYGASNSGKTFFAMDLSLCVIGSPGKAPFCIWRTKEGAAQSTA